MNVKTLVGKGMLVGLEMGNKCGILVTEVNTGEMTLQDSACRCLGR